MQGRCRRQSAECRGTYPSALLSAGPRYRFHFGNHRPPTGFRFVEVTHNKPIEPIRRRAWAALGGARAATGDLGRVFSPEPGICGKWAADRLDGAYTDRIGVNR